MTPRKSELGFLIILLFFLVDFPWATFLKGPGGVWRHVARRGGRLETKLDLDRDSASVPGSRTLPRRFKWNHEDLNLKEIQARLPVETISSSGCANIESHLILGRGSCFLCWNSLGNSIALKLHFWTMLRGSLTTCSIRAMTDDFCSISHRFAKSLRDTNMVD